MYKKKSIRSEFGRSYGPNLTPVRRKTLKMVGAASILVLSIEKDRAWANNHQLVIIVQALMGLTASFCVEVPWKETQIIIVIIIIILD